MFQLPVHAATVPIFEVLSAGHFIAKTMRLPS